MAQVERKMLRKQVTAMKCIHEADMPVGVLTRRLPRVCGPLSPHCPLAGTLGVLCPVTRKCSAGQEMQIRGLALGAGGPMRLCAVKAQ